MCECIVCALSVVQQVAKKLVFFFGCFCSVRFVGALSGDCGFVSMVCICVCVYASFVYMERKLLVHTIRFLGLACSLKGFGVFMHVHYILGFPRVIKTNLNNKCSTVHMQHCPPTIYNNLIAM